MQAMSETIIDGGCAFPSHGTMGEVVYEGMSLRDYFAAKAMASELALDQPVSPNVIAASAYAMADAMLRARAQERTE
jgi:hypothetical protein